MTAKRWLIGAVVVGALVRLPGVAWGVNWPDGFTVHHPDEYTHVANANAIISALETPPGPPYPRAMGALAAAPYLLWYAAQGHFGGPRIHLPWTVGAGRLISVVFGLAAILIVFAIGRDALGDDRAGLMAAWLLALGGLHVTQSHFFLSDTAAVTCTLLAVWLLWRDLKPSRVSFSEKTIPGLVFLCWAAFAAGCAFAFKLFVFVFPALAYGVLARPPRLKRAILATAFVVAGMALPSLGFESPASLRRTLTEGVSIPFEFDRVKSALLYAVQLPSIFSLPLLIIATAGTWSLWSHLRSVSALTRRHALVVFGSVPLVGLLFVLFRLDHFPRHWVFLIPWAAIAGGWWLARATERLQRAGRSPALVLAPVFLWMLAFVADGERYFIFEPRNDALRWVRANVPEDSSLFWTQHRAPSGYRNVQWLVQGDPDVLVLEMYEANQFLSGVNWRDSYPSDPHEVFDGRTAERVARVQSVFRGTSEYAEAARFPDAYVMPEYRLVQWLTGDRSRNYITEVVIFRRHVAPNKR